MIFMFPLNSRRNTQHKKNALLLCYILSVCPPPPTRVFHRATHAKQKNKRKYKKGYGILKQNGSFYKTCRSNLFAKNVPK
mmetsp:Transcript_11844/g.17403  ORF Transcript_11844/g.17403 Transcript_11844/m.17403 type:complete len:80 (-) Transcript_11844:29-268(-)